MISAPKKEHRLPVILSLEEVLRLLEAAPSFSHQVIFSTMYGTGARVSEALHLRVPDIDSQHMMIPYGQNIQPTSERQERQSKRLPESIARAGFL